MHPWRDSVPWTAVRPAQGARPDEAPLLAELEALHREIDALQTGHRCAGSTVCCHFGLTGREPFLTSIEWQAVEHALARRGGPLGRTSRARPLRGDAEGEQICPLLTREGRCAIYQDRPLGCRTYWCARALRPHPVAPYLRRDLLRRVLDIAARHQPQGDCGRPLSQLMEEYQKPLTRARRPRRRRASADRG
ncbi:MAG: YkgJ family cysteine cluster protein [Deltaproteobacteria bacterium]|nr:YkgJ family cysteine cluster protein [Deltaproteobacteria bacterium]